MYLKEMRYNEYPTVWEKAQNEFTHISLTSDHLLIKTDFVTCQYAYYTRVL